ncbi:uncharacterized protein LOC105838811 [Monomorium pharaonis]|uniref:uncharacterized protein LOC105838811 n=1 Tax=Monomorium pharaonis TaxID=307658 RepID=UPI001746926F|nr:uncharacterized protein LOC105838811 [Monomorium pharaonis]
MKLTLGLIAVLTIVGLGQAYPSQDFGKSLAIKFAKNSAIGFGKSGNLQEELEDFINLIPAQEFVDIIVKYVNEDVKVQEAIQFLSTNEFRDLLRALEALKEYQAFIEYLKNAIESAQKLYRAMGMEEYVLFKIESFFKTQKIGDGMKGMIKDLYNILPLDKINALYEEKMRTSKVYADFITKIASKEMRKIISDLVTHETYKEFITKTKEKGWEFEGLSILSAIIIGIPINI